MDSPLGDVATVGSSNLDPLSLLLAREANVFVRDDAFAGELRAHLAGAMATAMAGVSMPRTTAVARSRRAR